MNLLAIDIGASSGRHILSRDGKTEEIFRFKTGFVSENGRLYNDVERLFGNVLEGIRRTLAVCPSVDSLAIDTWGVDYVLLRGDEPVLPVYAYRDLRGARAAEKVHAILPFAELYRRTGTQYQPFNTIYQLYDDKETGRLEGVTDLLMLPEYLSYRLTGKKTREFTSASTTGLLSAVTREFDTDIIRALGLPAHLFPKLSEGGTLVGDFLPEIAAQVGGNIPVRLCLSHDTASAVYAIPAPIGTPYISSGTWSLLGVRTPFAHTDEGSLRAEFSNEGDAGRGFRYQKNIAGMFAVNRIAEDLGLSPAKFSDEGGKEPYPYTLDFDDPRFFAPEHFLDEVYAALDEKGLPRPKTPGELATMTLSSIAENYARAVRDMEEVLGTRSDTLVIVGGGARCLPLNRMTEEKTGKHVLALPIEATALGNLKIQEESIRHESL